METILKRITEFDKGLVAQLFQRLGEKDINPNPSFFRDIDTILLVSYTDGVPSGFLYAYALPGLETPYPKMFLYSIDVFDGFCRKGIGSKLIGDLRNLANAAGCSELFVLTNRSNEAAMDFYGKTGGKIENGDDVLFVYGREALKA